MDISKDSIKKLITYFPEILLPITLSEDLALVFSAENRALPDTLISETIGLWEKLDEFTELIPCFNLTLETKHHALVYWKGSLMSYEYVLVTFSENLDLISKKVIAGTISNGRTIKKSIANIDKELNINAVVGESLADSKYNPTNSKAYNFEILPDGVIVASEEHNNLWQ